MSPLSGPVLAAAALVSAPALWGALVDGTTTPQTAALRYLICMAICWAGFAVVGMLVGPAPRPPVEAPAAAPDPTRDGDAAD